MSSLGDLSTIKEIVLHIYSHFEEKVHDKSKREPLYVLSLLKLQQRKDVAAKFLRIHYHQRGVTSASQNSFYTGLITVDTKVTYNKRSPTTTAAIDKISGKFFIFQQEGAQANRAHETINLFACNLASVRAFKKMLSSADSEINFALKRSLQIPPHFMCFAILLRYMSSITTSVTDCHYFLTLIFHRVA